jgi:NAD(P)-dependent dehydrogenase (short-subunit alcohol dehydrogenase family)
VPLDLRDFPAIDRLGAALFERYKKLDILVGNAGVLGPVSPLGHIDPPAWDEVLAVNVTANWRLIRSFDPLLRASDAGRVVLVTSGVTAQARAYWGPYSVSKAAVDMLARIYASETASTNVKVNVFGPGPIRTRLRAQGFPGEDPLTLDTPEQVAPYLLAMCLPGFQESGKFYSYPMKALLEFRAPARASP